MGRLVLKNGIILTPFKKLYGRCLLIDNGRIEKMMGLEQLESYKKKYGQNYQIIDVRNNYISPGFIDIHIHGANNSDIVKDAIEPVCTFLPIHGITGFVPTLWTIAGLDELTNACRRISNYISKKDNEGSRVLGINAEGPYLNPKMAGMAKKELTAMPRQEEYSRLYEESKGYLKIITVSPEIEGSLDLIKYMVEKNVVVSIGHTELSPKNLDRVLNLGMKLITHTFDAFSPGKQVDKGVKATGIEEELLIRDELTAELICDKYGTHVSKTLINILLRCKGVEKIILVTDSMNVTGNPPGKYHLRDGREVVLEEAGDVLRMADNRELAASAMTLDLAIRNMISHTGIDIENAVRMATYNPAEILGISNIQGEIREGMLADLAVFNPDVEVLLTIIGGQVYYNRLY